MTTASKANFLRSVLFAAAIFNLFASLMLVFPSTVGKFAELPSAGSFFYSSMLALLVGIYGLIYGLLAFRNTIDRSLLILAVIGKMGVFFISLYCMQANIIGVRAFSVAIGDFLFALIFFWWLISERKK